MVRYLLIIKYRFLVFLRTFHLNKRSISRWINYLFHKINIFGYFFDNISWSNIIIVSLSLRDSLRNLVLPFLLSLLLACLNDCLGWCLESGIGILS